MVKREEEKGEGGVVKLILYPQVDIWSVDVSSDDHRGSSSALRLYQQLCPRQPGPSALSEISADLQQQVSHKFQDSQDWHRHLLRPCIHSSHPHVDPICVPHKGKHNRWIGLHLFFSL